MKRKKKQNNAEVKNLAASGEAGSQESLELDPNELSAERQEPAQTPAGTGPAEEQPSVRKAILGELQAMLDESVTQEEVYEKQEDMTAELAEALFGKEKPKKKPEAEGQSSRPMQTEKASASKSKDTASGTEQATAEPKDEGKSEKQFIPCGETQKPEKAAATKKEEPPAREKPQESPEARKLREEVEAMLNQKPAAATRPENSVALQTEKASAPEKGAEAQKGEQSAEEQKPVQRLAAQKAETPSEKMKAELAKAIGVDLEAAKKNDVAPKAPLASVSYESVAKAAESLKKEPTGRFSRDAVDEGEFLNEICTLIGDGTKVYQPKSEEAAENTQPESRTADRQPVLRISAEDLQEVPDNPEDILEDDSTGVSGWIKGVFLLIISLLLSGMTFYAVFAELMGKKF